MSAPALVVRRAAPADAEAEAAIYNQGIEARTATFEIEPRTADDRRQAIEAAAAPGGRFPILVVEADGHVLGWASRTEHAPRACYRGNEASRAMCRRAGFREVGVYERHARLGGQWLDVGIVERLLPENQG